jgi:hypothetical protein
MSSSSSSSNGVELVMVPTSSVRPGDILRVLPGSCSSADLQRVACLSQGSWLIYCHGHLWGSLLTCPAVERQRGAGAVILGHVGSGNMGE